MKKIAFNFGLSLMILTGCTSTFQKVDIQTKNTSSLAVEFVANDTYKVVPQQGTVRLYAVETRMADVPATLIQQKKVEVSQVPFTVNFSIPEDHRQRIQPPIRDDAEITYYVTWESDAKNLTGKDAIVIDYDRKFPRVSLTGGKQQIFLRTVK